MSLSIRWSWILNGLLASLVGVLLFGCSQDSSKAKPATAEPTDFVTRAVNAGDESGNWLLHGRTYSEQRHSPLVSIDTSNVSELGLEWFIDLPEPRGQEATPIIVDGVMYSTAAWSMVYALDAKTGEQLWHFDPKVSRAWGAKACCDVVNRGVAYWDGRIIVGTIDGRLIALDASTGDELWSVLTIDTDKPYSITGAPRVVNGKVFIGNGGAEFGVRGYVTAYDVANGNQLWRFYTVPGDPSKPFENDALEMAASTWSGEWWTLGGGGTAWDSMAYDAKLNLLYIGTGNGSPWNPKLRSNGEGDNLFLSSIVAVNADTGEYAWHYQTTPGEGWDYTATQHMILADLEIDGTVREVIMQAPKNGFFYVLDRRTGAFISAEPFVRATWASHVDTKTGRPVINPEAKYWETGTPALVTPAWSGGHSWHPMSYSPNTGLVYIPAQEMGFPYLATEELVIKTLGANLGVDTKVAQFPDDPAAIQAIKDAAKGHLAAWDPVAQKEVWRVQHKGVLNGGVLSTAGNLVLQGDGAGLLSAYRADTGEALWQFDAQTGIVAPPVTYEVDGEQYVTVVVGWGGIIPLMTGPISWNAGEPVNRSRVLTFKLGGTASLPEPNEPTRTMVDLTNVTLDTAAVNAGFESYDSYCVHCHGAAGVGGGVIPDLRYSGYLQSADAWRAVVVDGALTERGMVSFGAELSAESAEQIRQYVIGRNQFAHRVGDTSRISR